MTPVLKMEVMGGGGARTRNTGNEGEGTVKRKGVRGNGEKEGKGRKEVLSEEQMEREVKMLEAVNEDEFVNIKKREWNAKMGRKVIPLETIIALRKRRLSYPQIAKVLGCSEENVKQRLHKVADEIERVEDFKRHRADILAIHQNRILSAIDQGALEKASLKDKGIAFGILYDKERLERGRATSHIVYADLMQMKSAKLKELEELDRTPIQKE